MDTNDKLAFFLDMMQCTGPISYLVYNQQGKAMDMVGKLENIHLFFENSDCLAYALHSKDNAPLCLNNEKLRIDDIRHQDSSSDIGRKLNQSSHYYNYKSEEKLLFHIREGDLNYKDTTDFAATVGKGINIRTKDPMTQMLISITSFTTLCIRAAIEGGLPADTAHTVETAYIQSMIGCKNISELGALYNAMYKDFIHRVHKIKNSAALSPQICACCEYIQLHPEEDLPITSLAKLIGYTDYYLSRKFKAEVGQNIRGYIDDVRIRHARMLLKTTSLTIAEIAQMLHYCSGTHFSRVFKESTGSLPRDYRQEAAS